MSPNPSVTPHVDLDALLDVLAAKIAARISAPPAVESEWLTPKQTAELLGLEVNTLEIQRAKGSSDLPFYKVGRNTVRYKRAEVLAWMERDRRTSTSGPVRTRRTK